MQTVKMMVNGKQHLANGLLYPDLVSEIGASAGSAHEQDRLISCGASQGCDLGL